MENILDKTTQIWVKLTGKRIEPKQYSWLIGPIGDSDKIGDKFVSRLANENNLNTVTNLPDSGLLENINDLGLTELELRTIRPEIIDFYERTSNYDFEFWSEWKGLFRPFVGCSHYFSVKDFNNLICHLTHLTHQKELKVK